MYPTDVVLGVAFQHGEQGEPAAERCEKTEALPSENGQADGPVLPTTGDQRTRPGGRPTGPFPRSSVDGGIPRREPTRAHTCVALTRRRTRTGRDGFLSPSFYFLLPGLLAARRHGGRRKSEGRILPFREPPEARELGWGRRAHRKAGKAKAPRRSRGGRTFGNGTPLLPSRSRKRQKENSR